MKTESYNTYVQSIESATNTTTLETIHKDLFSKTGIFATHMKALASLSEQEKKELGMLLNQQKNSLLEIFKNKQNTIMLAALEEKIAKQKLDLTLTSKHITKSGLHPISYVTEEISDIFNNLGFKLISNNEIEDDWHNFTALNVPHYHPSRADHDTFYLNSLDSQGLRKLLRTHTSNMQIRTMLDTAKNNIDDVAKIKIISTGRTYRSDSDATHSPMFHQMEGLLVSEKNNISVPLLKSILEYFCSKFFEAENLKLRFRPSYFPFTSPSYEIDVNYSKKDSNIVIGTGDLWLEVLGCGIVHSRVLENCGIDSKKYGALAFGMGLERLLMLKYGFTDIREMFVGDVRWLSYYNFST